MGDPTFVGLARPSPPNRHRPRPATHPETLITNPRGPRPSLGAPFYLLQQGDRWGCISTKLNQRGLASIDRNNKTTLLFTAPSDITKSYAKVLSPRMVNCKTSASTRDFSPSTIANLLRFRALGALFVSDYDVWEVLAAFWHGF